MESVILKNRLTIPRIQGKFADMIECANEIKTLKGFLKRYPVTAIIGARQVGKTTLARNLITSYKKPVN